MNKKMISHRIEWCIGKCPVFSIFKTSTWYLKFALWRSFLEFVLILRPFHFWCTNCALGALTFFASTNIMNETSSWACLSLGIKCSLSMKRVSTVMHCQADWSLIDTHKTCWLVAVVRGGFQRASTDKDTLDFMNTHTGVRNNVCCLHVESWNKTIFFCK